MAAMATGPARAAFERLMARCAAGLRGGSAIAAGIAAVVGLTPPASPALVGVAIAGLLAWAGSYAAAALTRGWSRWLVAGDIAVPAALCLAHPRLVPMHALAAAEREARVTVVARSDEVAVSVLAYGRIREPADLPGLAGAGVTVTRQQGEDQRWVEARWRRG